MIVNKINNDKCSTYILDNNGKVVIVNCGTSLDNAMDIIKKKKVSAILICTADNNYIYHLNQYLRVWKVPVFTNHCGYEAISKVIHDKSLLMSHSGKIVVDGYSIIATDNIDGSITFSYNDRVFGSYSGQGDSESRLPIH